MLLVGGLQKRQMSSSSQKSEKLRKLLGVRCHRSARIQPMQEEKQQEEIAEVSISQTPSMFQTDNSNK